MQPVISHLEELRSRLILIIAIFFILFLAGFFFSNHIIELIKGSLLQSNQVSLIATSPLEYVYAKLKIGFLIALIFTFPLIIYETLVFIKPGLNLKEKKLIRKFLPFSLLLFLTGLAFSYFILLKIGIWFLAKISIEAGIENLWTITKFISFIFMTSIALGLIFQLPLLLLILFKLNIVTLDMLKTKRKYALILIFILAALITPPDIITQILVALPMICLYEFSILTIRLNRK